MQRDPQVLTAIGSGLAREQPVMLSRLIDLVSERFGTDFTDADQLFFDQIIEAALLQGDLRQAAKVNSLDKFSMVFSGLLESLFVERVDQNVEIFARYMNDDAFQKEVGRWLSTQVYDRLTNDKLRQASSI